MGSPYDPDFLSQIKDRLSRRFQELSRGMKTHRDRIGHEVPQDFADAASHKEEENLLTNEDQLGGAEIDLIEEALQRIESGEYGLCADCRAGIPQERLTLVPHARFCVSCQEKREGKKRR